VKSQSYISGWAHALPEKIVSNEDIVKIMNTSVDFIVKRTGVHTRRHLSIDEGLSSLALPAGKKAILQANLSPKDIDMLIVNTLSPDYHDPSEACLLQPGLQLNHVPCFDIRAQCSGFLYAIDIADQFITTGRHKNILIVCGEVLSKRMDVSDDGRNLAILLGDGAAGVVVSKKESVEHPIGVLDIITKADGSYFELLWTKSPGSANPKFETPNDNPEFQGQYFRMNGRPMFEHASESLAAIAQEILKKNHLTLKDVNVIIPHQPNMRILDRVAELLDLDDDLMIKNVDQLGNMASASMPVTLSMGMNQGKIKQGDLALFLGYGSGATWGAMLYQF